MFSRCVCKILVVASTIPFSTFSISVPSWKAEINSIVVSETNSLPGSMVCRLGRSIGVILAVDDNDNVGSIVVVIVDCPVFDIVGTIVVCLVSSPVDIIDGIVVGDLAGNGDGIFVGNRVGLVLNFVVSAGDSVGVSSTMVGELDKNPLRVLIWVWAVLSLIVGEVVGFGIGIEDSVTRRKVCFSSFSP